jgi:hypothetical protein
MRLGDIVEKVRSKNAGPFWLTVDIFCGTPQVFDRVRAALTSERVARLAGTEVQLLKRFEIADLNVVKFSFPRPAIQGTRFDRDMHGAAFGAMLADEDLA